jgi:hypothetical protein
MINILWVLLIFGAGALFGFLVMAALAMSNDTRERRRSTEVDPSRTFATQVDQRVAV